MGKASAKALKNAVFEQVAQYRRSLGEGRTDLSGLEDGVSAYCDAVAALPRDEARLHAQDLEALMREISALGEALKAAREGIRMELAALGRLKQANVAYSKSDAIGPVHRRREEEDE